MLAVASFHKRENPLSWAMCAIIVLAVSVVSLVLCSCSASLAISKNGEGGALVEANVTRVVDGDTIVVEIDGSTQKLRLIGIDAPESVHPDEGRNTASGDEASEHLREILPKGRRVWLQKDISETDRYGRLLRYVWVDEPRDLEDPSEVRSKMLNAILVRDGFAQAKRYEPDTRYADVLDTVAG